MELEPQSYNLTVDTLGFIGDDELNFIIQTDKIKKNRGTYVEGTLVKSLFNTDVILNEIQFNNDAIWINLQYTPHGNPIHPYRTLKTEMPLTTNAAEIMGNIYNIKRSIPNVISLYNHNLQEYNWLGSIQGAIKQQDDSISFCISREFWNSSKEILVVIKNLTYEIHVDKSVHIKLNGE